ncbi:transporter substrate-binding domain-containing protein [Jeotgalibacillus terrae]|uniref:Transporter substrate-binding domain-containing protein n=1 Tax=Jeotgalibacillus terrae TaxID=587735 RepID=A0ABW5ZND5_9BACL|nr:transporter substrate-binding domain-containing protein [Jeotgalibacillus terrae]MBM7578128.1 polar amino acid transport system substrate-binding protein [Jeotgalibacillus terrae]
MKKLTGSVLLLSTALILGACGSEESDSGSGDGGDEQVYKVGIDTTYPPFEYEEDGEYKGIDIDLINAIAENQGFEIELSPMDFGGIIPAMQAGQLDLAIAGMSITDERKEVVDFSDPYFEAGLSLVVGEDNSDVTTLEDLAGETIAVKNGTTGATYAQEQAEEIGFEVVQFNDSPAMFQEVANGNAAALIEDYPVIAYAIAQDDLGLQTVGDRLNGDQYGIAVLKGENADLLEKINAGLAELKESGEYDEIVATYLGEEE